VHFAVCSLLVAPLTFMRTPIIGASLSLVLFLGSVAHGQAKLFDCGVPPPPPPPAPGAPHFNKRPLARPPLVWAHPDRTFCDVALQYSMSHYLEDRPRLRLFFPFLLNNFMLDHKEFLTPIFG